MIDWQKIVVEVAVGLGVPGFTVWLGKLLFERWLEKRAELEKASMDRLLELEKAALAQRALEHRVRFEALHAKRAEAIYENWLALTRAVSAVGLFVHPAQMVADDEQLKNGKEALALACTARTRARESTIFFSQALGDRLHEFAKELDVFCFSALLEFKSAKEEGTNPYLAHERGSSSFGEAWGQLDNKLKPALAELGNELRKLLGIE